MRRRRWIRTGSLVLGGMLMFTLPSCSRDDSEGMVAVSGKPGRMKSAATVRAERRAFDGAPPVIPHEQFTADCRSCHTPEGLEIAGVGYAPPMPHGNTSGMSAISRCRQCHIYSEADDLFVENGFIGLRQDLRHGRRLNDEAPPVMPHPTHMRENCLACHSGPAAREEIRTPHPERPLCRQCHVEEVTTDLFVRS